MSFHTCVYIYCYTLVFMCVSLLAEFYYVISFLTQTLMVFLRENRVWQHYYLLLLVLYNGGTITCFLQ